MQLATLSPIMALGLFASQGASALSPRAESAFSSVLSCHPSSTATWTVPTPAQTLYIAAAGGNGGDSEANPGGGNGAFINASIILQDGDVLLTAVGCPGSNSHSSSKDHAAGGWGGFGYFGGQGTGATADAGPRNSGAGGGATSIILHRGGNSSLLLVAAGGGGSGGESLTISSSPNGGSPSDWTGADGRNGSLALGGKGGKGGGYTAGNGAGQAGQGGSQWGGGGGGGGAGYVGGNAGSGASGSSAGGGGGSGSSYYNPAYFQFKPIIQSAKEYELYSTVIYTWYA